MKNFLANKWFWGLMLGAAFLQAQSTVSVTVTNSNLGLVREQRKIDLQKGVQTFLLTDIPQRIVPTSVLIEQQEPTFNVLEQNYEYDLISADKVLEKSLNQKIWLQDPNYGLVQGKLLSNSGSNLMLLDKEGRLQIIPKNDKQKVILEGYAQRSNSFVTRPALLWKVKAEKSGKHAFTLSYLTNGLQWHADYVGKLDANDKHLNLACWVTINNNSGKEYRNARLKLMAGNLNIAPKEPPGYTEMRIMAAKAAPRFEEKAFFEYHLYTLNGTTTLKDNQVKQIRLFAETPVAVQKKYQVTSRNPKQVQVKIEFKNSKQNHLGIPLPAGKVRLYKDDGKEMEFVGEDRISHTPKDETVRLTIGNAFDIVSERNLLKSERIGKSASKQTVQYKIRNHKKNAVTVEVFEMTPTYREAELLSSDLKPVETRANYFKFKVKVGAGQEATLQMTYLLK